MEREGHKHHSEQTIQRILYKYYQKQDYTISNVYVFPWECDFFLVTKGGMMYEIEIKLDRHDFRREKQKDKKHMILKDVYESGDPGNKLVPNKFIYCAPEGVIPEEEVEEYAGLMEITPEDGIRMIRAPFIHERREDIEKILLKKFYNRMKKIEKILSTFRIRMKKDPTGIKKHVEKFLKTIRM